MFSVPSLLKVPTFFVPPDASTLVQAPYLPDSSYQLCKNLSSSTLGAFSFSHREMEEQITNAGNYICVASDLDWLNEGASLLKEMVANPELAASSTHQPFLQRYQLQTNSKVLQRLYTPNPSWGKCKKLPRQCSVWNQNV